MMERNASKRLKGDVQMDDAYLGGQRPGAYGREGKALFLAAVSVTGDGKPDRSCFAALAVVRSCGRGVRGGRSRGIRWAAAFPPSQRRAAPIPRSRPGSGPKAAKHPRFKWVNTVLGNIKAAMVGTYRAVRDKHTPRYLAEFEYRFNRAYWLDTMIGRLAYVSLRTAPMPYRLLKLADVYA